jgi:hypothetical protein
LGGHSWEKESEGGRRLKGTSIGSFSSLASGPAFGICYSKGCGFRATGNMYVPLSKKPDPLFGIPVAEEDYSFVHGKFYRGDAYLGEEPNLQRMGSVGTESVPPHRTRVEGQ